MIPVMKLARTMIVMCLLMYFWCPVQAEDGSPVRQEAEAPSLVHQIGMKLGRGIANFTTGWAEIPKQIYTVSKNEGWVTGATRGAVDGLGMFVARTIAGGYEMLSFPFPIPPHYQPLLQPDFVWQPEPPLDRSEAAAPSQGPASDPPINVLSSP